MIKVSWHNGPKTKIVDDFRSEWCDDRQLRGLLSGAVLWMWRFESPEPPLSLATKSMLCLPLTDWMSKLMLSGGYLPCTHGGDLCSGCYVTSGSRGLVFSDERPKLLHRNRSSLAFNFRHCELQNNSQHQFKKKQSCSATFMREGPFEMMFPDSFVLTQKMSPPADSGDFHTTLECKVQWGAFDTWLRKAFSIKTTPNTCSQGLQMFKVWTLLQNPCTGHVYLN